jgi:hypothetical protein
MDALISSLPVFLLSALKWFWSKTIVSLLGLLISVISIRLNIDTEEIVCVEMRGGSLSAQLSGVGDVTGTNRALNLVSSWPESDLSLDRSQDTDYEQHEPPKELTLFLSEEQTPPEIRDIVLRSLERQQQPEAQNGEPSAPNDSTENGTVVATADNEALSADPSTTNAPDISSPSASSTSLSLSTSPTTNSSEEGTRHGSKKATLSAILSTTTNLIGLVKHALQDSSSSGKAEGSESSRKLRKSRYEESSVHPPTLF